VPARGPIRSSRDAPVRRAPFPGPAAGRAAPVDRAGLAAGAVLRRPVHRPRGDRRAQPEQPGVPRPARPAPDRAGPQAPDLGVTVTTEDRLEKVTWWTGHATVDGRRVDVAGWDLPLARRTGLGTHGEQELGRRLAKSLSDA